MINILIVEDDADFNRAICTYMTDNGFSARGCLRAEEACDVLAEGNFDLLVSDIMMPGMDGFALAEAVRAVDEALPILFISAKGDLPSKQKGFGMGIDDYLVKPFDLEELLLRVKALLRRADINASSRLEIGSFSMDANTTDVLNGDTPVSLTAREFKILYKLLSTPNKTFTRSQLLNEFWGIDSETTLRAVDNYISNLRDKLSGCEEFRLVTVRGFGYKAVIDR